MGKINKNHYLLIIIFMLLFLLPAFDNIFHFSPVKELFEKRLPVSRPHFSWNYHNLVNYPQQYEEFYNDHFGLRKTLISINSAIMDKIFNQSPSSHAVFGREGWLYFSNKGSLVDVAGKLIYNPAVLQKGIDALFSNWQRLSKMGIDYVLVIAPDKSTIYPEYLPSYITPGGKSRLDQFLAAMKKEHPDFPLIDLRPVLLRTKKQAVIYHKTDTHWNRLGSYIGYQEIMKFITKKYPQLRPVSQSAFILQTMKERGDIADIMNLQLFDSYEEFIPRHPLPYHNITSDADRKIFHKPQFYRNDDKSLPVLLVYKDSFMDSLLYFLSNNFSESYYINEFPCELNMEIVKKYRTNIVIQQMWEGRMEEVLESC